MSSRPNFFQQIKKRLTQDPDEQEYIGNIWGWRFSIIGLVIVILFSILLWYRTSVMGIPINEQEASPFRQDTTHLIQ